METPVKMYEIGNSNFPPNNMWKNLLRKQVKRLEAHEIFHVQNAEYFAYWTEKLIAA